MVTRHSDRSKELPASRWKCLLGSVLLYLPFQKIMTQRNIVALEARGAYVFLVCLFVALCSTLFCFPSFLPSLFFVTDFVSVLPSGTNSYSLFFSAEKNG